MSAIAIARNVRISPRKVAIVASLVRGQSVENAITILENTPRRSATAVLKAVKSASANATHNHNYKSNGLYISEISVTNGTRYKRYRPIARGSAHPYLLKSSHIRVVVDGEVRQVANKKSDTKDSKKEEKK